MTPEEAIEILNDHACKKMKVFDEDLEEAEKLGIEALKFRQRWEQQEGDTDFWRLPGESKG